MAVNFASRYLAQLNAFDSGRDFKRHVKIEEFPITYSSMVWFMFLNYSAVILFMAFVICLLKI